MKGITIFAAYHRQEEFNSIVEMVLKANLKAKTKSSKQENEDKDVEFIALAFEVAKTQEKAFQRINRLKKRIGIEYPIVLAQYGGSNKKKAQEKFNIH